MSNTNVRVAIRIRPLTTNETIEGNSECISLLEGNKQIIIGKNHSFSFDTVFDNSTSQLEIYNVSTIPLIDKFLEGYHATIFAYGQTGSGKTYTMGTGIDGSMDEVNLGIVPRSIKDIFKRLSIQYPQYNPLVKRSKNDPKPPYQIYASFLEIYNEEVKDLLSLSASSLSDTTKPNLVIREDASGEIYLAGSVEEEITGPDDLYNVLRRGTLCRTTGSTDMNLTSSRSHAIFSVVLRQTKNNASHQGNGDVTAVDSSMKSLVSKFNFVDLAGSERLKRTNAVGNRVKEAISINSGLLALGNVISALGDATKPRSHIPYRDSKLTRLLQNSLGGNSQTLMMACVSPADCNFQESLNTLKYANRAKNIQNKVSINEDGVGSVFEIAQLKKLVMTLKQELLLLKSSTGIYHHSSAVTGNANTSNAVSGQTSFHSSVNDLSISSLKSGKEKLERKINELMNENTNLRVRFDLLADNNSAGILTSLDNLLKSPIITGLMNMTSSLKSKLAIYESSGEYLNINQSHLPNNSATNKANTSANERLIKSDPKLNLLNRVKQEIQDNIMVMGVSLPENEDVDQEDEDTDTSDENRRDSCNRPSRSLLEKAVRSVQKDMIDKQELVNTIERLMEDSSHMKSKYEQQLTFLQDTITSIRKEKTEATKSLVPKPQLNKISRDKYEMKIKKLSKELTDLKEKYGELQGQLQSKVNRQPIINESVLEGYKNTIQNYKVERNKIIQTMTEEMNRLRFTVEQRDAEIRELKLLERSAQEETKMLKKSFEHQKSILKKKSSSIVKRVNFKSPTSTPTIVLPGNAFNSFNPKRVALKAKNLDQGPSSPPPNLKLKQAAIEQTVACLLSPSPKKVFTVESIPDGLFPLPQPSSGNLKINANDERASTPPSADLPFIRSDDGDATYVSSPSFAGPMSPSFSPFSMRRKNPWVITRTDLELSSQSPLLKEISENNNINERPHMRRALSTSDLGGFVSSSSETKYESDILDHYSSHNRRIPTMTTSHTSSLKNEHTLIGNAEPIVS